MKPSHLRTAVLAALAVMLHAVPVHAAAADTPAAAQAAPSAAINPQAVLGAMERVADWQLANPSKHRPTTGRRRSATPASWRWPTCPATASTAMRWSRWARRTAGSSAPRTTTRTTTWSARPTPSCICSCASPRCWRRCAPASTPSSRNRTKARWSSPQGQPGPLVVVRRPVHGTADLAAPVPPPPATSAISTHAVSEWWVTSDYLYDKDEHLYYRDSNYFDQREANGKQGVLGTRQRLGDGRPGATLQYLPANHPARPRFEQQFKEMAAKVLTLQQADGLWRASLLDPASYPMKETSGTALFAYALRMGRQPGPAGRGLQARPCEARWAALVANVQPDGKLTHVQPIGLAPTVFATDADRSVRRRRLPAGGQRGVSHGPAGEDQAADGQRRNGSGGVARRRTGRSGTRPGMSKHRW
jgi:unsaturated rhamnogalacturonyl hydrolase